MARTKKNKTAVVLRNLLVMCGGGGGDETSHVTIFRLLSVHRRATGRTERSARLDGPTSSRSLDGGPATKVGHRPPRRTRSRARARAAHVGTRDRSVQSDCWYVKPAFSNFYIFFVVIRIDDSQYSGFCLWDFFVVFQSLNQNESYIP